ncbi:MAG: hypothetical protein HY053_07815 [Proteobacteria bacterium]|nr:hypothetical protein [Pseudomonadota bacterium]
MSADRKHPTWEPGPTMHSLGRSELFAAMESAMFVGTGFCPSADFGALLACKAHEARQEPPRNLMADMREALANRVSVPSESFLEPRLSRWRPARLLGRVLDQICGS